MANKSSYLYLYLFATRNLLIPFLFIFALIIYKTYKNEIWTLLVYNHEEKREIKLLLRW